MRRASCALALLAAAACQTGLEQPALAPSLDEPYFRCRVQPILTRSCSMFACHGDGRRSFTVFARNRLRLGGTEAGRNRFLEPDEREFNFIAARAFADARHPAGSLLLSKPLDERAGGLYHGGATEWDAGDVFLDSADPDYRTLLDWVEGATMDPSCEEPGSAL